MKNIVKITVALLFVCLFCSVKGQMRNEGARLVDAKLSMKATEVNGTYVIISYEIPYSGMVEIRLFDAKGQQIWQNQYDHTYGENRIILKASKFHPGETYAYVLNYKKDEVRETIVVPPSNFD